MPFGRTISRRARHRRYGPGRYAGLCLAAVATLQGGAEAIKGPERKGPGFLSKATFSEALPFPDADSYDSEDSKN